MKKLIRIAVLVAALAAIAWLIKDRLVPAPEPLEEAPPFRPPPPPPPAPPAAATPPAAAAADDLTEITGIGPAFAARLHELGVATFAALAGADAAELASQIPGASEERIAAWIGQAGALA